MWWFSDAGSAFTFGVLTYSSTQWYRYSILIHSKVCMRQWDWHKNRNRSLLGKKTKWDKNFHVQCAQTNNNTNRKNRHQRRPNKSCGPLTVLFSNCRKYIYNKRYSWRGNRTSHEMLYSHRPFIYMSQSILLHTFPSYLVCQVSCGYYALVAQTLFQWYAADLAFFHFLRQDKCGAS